MSGNFLFVFVNAAFLLSRGEHPTQIKPQQTPNRIKKNFIINHAYPATSAGKGTQRMHVPVPGCRTVIHHHS